MASAMVIPKEILTDYKEIYEKAVKLVNEESKNDPADDPYKSHYTARDLLLGMKEMLKNSLASVLAEEADDGKDDLVYQVIQAFVCRDLGRIYLFTEETSTGEASLRECIDLIKGKKTRPEAIIAYLGAVNELGIAYANRMEYKQSLELLTEVETSQVYGHLGELEKSAQYCHMTLKRQYSAQTYEPIDFALNSATLSQYFIGQNMFKEARHHLAAATLIIAEYESKISHTDSSISEQECQDLQETFKHRYADVARCWSKYGLALLAASKERLFNDDDEKLATDAKNLQIDSNKYCFPPDMPLENYESRISCDYCLTFDDAKEVYHFVIKWLDQAKEYYKPDSEASEYAKIIKDFAELYEHMAFFEEDPSNQSKMQKRRAKYYEELLELLNPSFYLNICRECWYGAGLSYCAILDIKLDCFKSSASPNPQELHKINQVCQHAIKHFKSFIQSYIEKDGSIKANIDVDEQKTWLYSHFHLGRLHYKMITPDQKLQLENLSNSLKYYKAFTEECVKLAEASKSLQAEIGVCREMVNLLPIKMSNVRKRLEK
uniref:KIF-binding protein n=1 Tax=Glossina morsitans morsitans TaxID=37546 RepID=A0A1B0GA80_GLOMM